MTQDYFFEEVRIAFINPVTPEYAIDRAHHFALYHNPCPVHFKVNGVEMTIDGQFSKEYYMEVYNAKIKEKSKALHDG